MRAAVTVIEYIAPDSRTTLRRGDKAFEFRKRLLCRFTFQIRYARRPIRGYLVSVRLRERVYNSLVATRLVASVME